MHSLHVVILIDDEKADLSHGYKSGEAPMDFISPSFKKICTDDNELATGSHEFVSTPHTTYYDFTSTKIGVSEWKTITIDDNDYNLDVAHFHGDIFGRTTPLEKRHLGVKLKKADVIIIVFSVFGPNVFQQIKVCFDAVNDYGCHQQVPILLVGNQLYPTRMSQDSLSNMVIQEKLIPKYKFTPAEGDKLAREINAVKYLECSSETGMGLRNVLYEAVWATLRPTFTDTSECEDYASLDYTKPVDKTTM